MMVEMSLLQSSLEFRVVLVTDDDETTCSKTIDSVEVRLYRLRTMIGVFPFQGYPFQGCLMIFAEYVVGRFLQFEAMIPVMIPG